MKKFKSLVLTVIGLLCSVSVSAEDFEVDGIYYNITSSTDMTVEVTYRGDYSNSYWDEYSDAVTIPESVNYYGSIYSVTSISSGAFLDCYGLTSVVIPNSVTSIGDRAFYYCFGLTSVVIPNSVTNIGEGAFEYCSGLTFVEIGNGVTSIGEAAFSVCSGLISIVVDDENTYYDSREGCNAIIEKCSNRLIAGCQSTIIPNSVTSIGDYAFYSCYGLTSVVIPNSVTSIGEGAFERCSGLTSIEIPNSVTSIGNDAFSGCNGLTSVVIPNSVTSIGNGAFYNTAWYNNQSDGVIYVGQVLYKYKGTMPSNTSIIVKDGTVSISPSTFSGCSGLTSVEIPNSVTSIGSGAFYNCSGLTSVEIGNSVTSIGVSAFYNCSGLTSVEIPNSVTSIGDYAFRGCSGLTRLSCYAKVPPTCGYGVFKGIDKEKCVLQVPGSSLAAYQQADQWKDFLFIEDVLTSIGGVTVGDAVPATADVYCTNGMLIKRNAGLKNLKHELPAGIYIIGGKKVLVK